MVDGGFDGPFNGSGDGFIDGILVCFIDGLLVGRIDGPFDTTIDGFTDGLLVGKEVTLQSTSQVAGQFSATYGFLQKFVRVTIRNPIH